MGEAILVKAGGGKVDENYDPNDKYITSWELKTELITSSKEYTVPKAKNQQFSVRIFGGGGGGSFVPSGSGNMNNGEFKLNKGDIIPIIIGACGQYSGSAINGGTTTFGTYLSATGGEAGNKMSGHAGNGGNGGIYGGGGGTSKAISLGNGGGSGVNGINTIGMGLEFEGAGLAAKSVNNINTGTFKSGGGGYGGNGGKSAVGIKHGEIGLAFAGGGGGGYGGNGGNSYALSYSEKTTKIEWWSNGFSGGGGGYGNDGWSGSSSCGGGGGGYGLQGFGHGGGGSGNSLPGVCILTYSKLVEN